MGPQRVGYNVEMTLFWVLKFNPQNDAVWDLSLSEKFYKKNTHFTPPF